MASAARAICGSRAATARWPVGEAMTAAEPGTREIVIEGGAIVPAKLDDQLALDTPRDIRAGDRRGGKELSERSRKQAIDPDRARIALSLLAFRLAFRIRPTVHRVPLRAALLVGSCAKYGRKQRAAPAVDSPPRLADQCSGPAVQRKLISMLLSNWHSTAKSRVKGAAGGISFLTPSTRAVIVVSPVAEASLLPISIVALG